MYDSNPIARKLKCDKMLASKHLLKKLWTTTVQTFDYLAKFQTKSIKTNKKSKGTFTSLFNHLA